MVADMVVGDLAVLPAAWTAPMMPPGAALYGVCDTPLVVVIGCPAAVVCGAAVRVKSPCRICDSEFPVMPLETRTAPIPASPSPNGILEEFIGSGVRW